MRHILVDHARTRRRLKRGGGAESVPFDQSFIAFEERAHDLVALDEALSKLESRRPAPDGHHRIALLRRTDDATGGGDAGHQRAAYEDWRLARAWLLREMEPA